MARHKASRFFGLAVAAGVLLLLPFWIGQVRLAMDTDLFDPDMFTLYGFFTYHDPELFAADYTAKYFMSQWMPPGFWALQAGWAKIADPRILHRALPLVMWLCCLWPVYAAGRRLGGRVNGFATLAVFACSSIFIFRMVGGMAHGFGFPLTWWVVAALLAGSPAGLALATLASALFYPVVAPVTGLTLALFVLFPSLSRGVRRGAWPLAQPRLMRFLWLCIPGALTLLIMWPMLSPSDAGYGRAINVLAEQQVYPEASNPLASIAPFSYTIKAYALSNSTRLGMEGGQMLTLGIFALLIANILLHDTRDRRPAGLKPYAYAVAFFFLMSLLFAFDHAYRFAIYNFPVLVTLFLPLSLRSLTRILPRRARGVSFITLVLAYVALVAQAEAQAAGYMFKLEPFQRRALDFISTLPKDAILAGWPGDRYGRIIEAVPYVAQRQALVTWAGHPIAHRKYVLEMRERMNAVTEAYLAVEPAPLLRLRELYGVDYLVVNLEDFAGEEPPSYIEPFSELARTYWERSDGHFYTPMLKDAAVYEADGILIIDLHKLPISG